MRDIGIVGVELEGEYLESGWFGGDYSSTDQRNLWQKDGCAFQIDGGRRQSLLLNRSDKSIRDGRMRFLDRRRTVAIMMSSASVTIGEELNPEQELNLGRF